MGHQIKCDGGDHLVTGQDEAEAKERLKEAQRKGGQANKERIQGGEPPPPPGDRRG